MVEEFEEGNVSLASLTDILAFHLDFERSFKLRLLGEGNAAPRRKMVAYRLRIGWR